MECGWNDVDDCPRISVIFGYIKGNYEGNRSKMGRQCHDMNEGRFFTSEEKSGF